MSVQSPASAESETEVVQERPGSPTANLATEEGGDSPDFATPGPATDQARLNGKDVVALFANVGNTLLGRLHVLVVPHRVLVGASHDMSLAYRPPVRHAGTAASVDAVQRAFIKLVRIGAHIPEGGADSPLRRGGGGTAPTDPHPFVLPRSPSMHDLGRFCETYEDLDWPSWLRTQHYPNQPAQIRSLVQWVRWCQTWAVDDRHVHEVSEAMPQMLGSLGISTTPREIALFYPLRVALVIAAAALECEVVRRTFATVHFRPRAIAEEVSDTVRARLADAFRLEAFADLFHSHRGSPGDSPSSHTMVSGVLVSARKDSPSAAAASSAPESETASVSPSGAPTLGGSNTDRARFLDKLEEQNRKYHEDRFGYIQMASPPDGRRAPTPAFDLRLTGAASSPASLHQERPPLFKLNQSPPDAERVHRPRLHVTTFMKPNSNSPFSAPVTPAGANSADNSPSGSGSPRVGSDSQVRLSTPNAAGTPSPSSLMNRLVSDTSGAEPPSQDAAAGGGEPPLYDVSGSGSTNVAFVSLQPSAGD